jgi:hypothetical protein
MPTFLLGLSATTSSHMGALQPWASCLDQSHKRGVLQAVETGICSLRAAMEYAPSMTPVTLKNRDGQVSKCWDTSATVPKKPWTADSTVR